VGIAKFFGISPDRSFLSSTKADMLY